MASAAMADERDASQVEPGVQHRPTVIMSLCCGGLCSVGLRLRLNPTYDLRRVRLHSPDPITQANYPIGANDPSASRATGPRVPAHACAPQSEPFPYTWFTDNCSRALTLTGPPGCVSGVRVNRAAPSCVMPIW
jgi:hypothetical protein